MNYASVFLLDKTTIFINADCYIENGFDKLKTGILRNGVVYALSRHEKPENIRKCKAADFCSNRYMFAHDAYVFHLAAPIPRKVIEKTDFRAHIYGLETVLIFNLREYGGFTVRNPCKILRILHNHCSNIRKPEDRYINGKSADQVAKVGLSHGMALFSDL